MGTRPARLSAAVVAFASHLCAQYGFTAVSGKAVTASQTLEAAPISERDRARDALRSVYCTDAREWALFPAAFEAFFGDAPRGIAQRLPADPRASRGRDARRGEDAARDARRERSGGDADPAGTHALRALYSPRAGAGAATRVAGEGLRAVERLAARLIRGVRLGRSRRTVALPHGRRIDLRRTVIASARTAGDPVALRFLGQSPHNPRFVILLDASRSMTPFLDVPLQLAYALCRRSHRARAFAFSTELRELTADLRRPGERGRNLSALGGAWGGGTRIGASLLRFVHAYGPAVLRRGTLVVIVSDGLDLGDLDLLTSAMEMLRLRSAGIVWLNPHAGSRGFTPSAGGMRRALPYLTTLAPATTLGELAELVDALVCGAGGDRR
jgi:uncharacterized protein with von Willebrand factor type A (vWA) domain